MKKFLLTIIGLGIILIGYYFSLDKTFPVGVTKNEWEMPGKEHLKLKTTKDKILSSRVIKEYREELFLGAATTSTTSQYVLVEVLSTPTSTVEYSYISNITATATPYFSSGDTTSKAEYLNNNNNKSVIAFYEKDKWAKDKTGSILNVLEATTTLGAFNGQIVRTPIENILGFFINTAIATTTATSSTTYTPPSAGTVAVLVVGGGGSGAWAGGGGGAGGFKASTSIPVTVQSYTITVGTGNVGGTPANGYEGFNGSSTVAFGITATGGGHGWGRAAGGKAADGASGGGGSSYYTGSAPDGFPGLGTAGQGNDGGHGGPNTANYGSGGGGGASTSGGIGSNSVGGDGGEGATSTLSGTTVCYAGGGGGAIDQASVGQGKCGGGNAGATGSGAGASATPNTGGGGGGGGQYSGNGGAGGSGIVIIVFTASGGGTTTTSNIINFD